MRYSGQGAFPGGKSARSANILANHPTPKPNIGDATRVSPIHTDGLESKLVRGMLAPRQSSSWRNPSSPKARISNPSCQGPSTNQRPSQTLPVATLLATAANSRVTRRLPLATVKRHPDSVAPSPDSIFARACARLALRGAYSAPETQRTAATSSLRRSSTGAACIAETSITRSPRSCVTACAASL